MKQFALLAGIAIGLVLGVGEGRAASTNAMITKLNTTALFTKVQQVVSNATSTNSVVGLERVKFGNPELLRLLGAEFNQNFLAGQQLGLKADFTFVLLDKSGNFLQDLSTNAADSSYAFYTTNVGARLTYGKEIKKPNSDTQELSELQPDFGIYYADGKGNNFHFGGLASIRFTQLTTGNLTTYKGVSLMIPSCTGGGTVLNPNDLQYEDVVFTGSWGASAAELEQ